VGFAYFHRRCAGTSLILNAFLIASRPHQAAVRAFQERQQWRRDDADSNSRDQRIGSAEKTHNQFKEGN
jgi:hypothetical protein